MSQTSEDASPLRKFVDLFTAMVEADVNDKK